MFEFINGKIAELTPTFAVIETAGVGYYLNISLGTFAAIDGSTGSPTGRNEAKLFVHFIVREDAQLLYGFATTAERELFRRLIGVSGVGPNTARMVLSTYSPAELASIIRSENAPLLKNVKGLGLKTAEKIIVELRDKMTGIAAAETAQTPGNANHEEALAALSMLGFSRAASEKAVSEIVRSQPSLSVEEVIRQALKKL